MNLEGKTALVTGASPNIMGGIAEELGRAGANLACIDINPEYAEKCAAAIAAEGRDAIGVVCDVTDEDHVVAAVGEATQRFGGVDILVNGAALFNFKGVLNMPVDEWRRQTDIILTGAFLFTKHVAHLMIEQERKGNIINIISTAGHQGEPGNVGYGTAKGGLLNFTRSVAMELSRYGIRVNSLTPTATGQAEGRERAARWGVEWPRPRLGERASGLLPDASHGAPLLRLPSPSNYGKAAVFLASDDAEMITGFDLRVDAGAISKYWIWSPGDA